MARIKCIMCTEPSIGICGLCDEPYCAEHEQRHEHPEPQSGPRRDAWLRSGLSWEEFERQQKGQLGPLETRRVWLVKSNTDLTEGKGRPKLVAACETEATARRLARGRGVQGSDAEVEEALAVRSISRAEFEWRWMVPMHLEHPTKKDKSAQEGIDRRREVEEKARAAGLTDDDIATLRERG